MHEIDLEICGFVGVQVSYPYHIGWLTNHVSITCQTPDQSYELGNALGDFVGPLVGNERFNRLAEIIVG